MAFGDVTKKFQAEKTATVKESVTVLPVEPESEPTVESHEGAAADTVQAVQTPQGLDGAAVLANAIVAAINSNQPKRVPYGRHKPSSRTDNPDGSPKPPLTRKYFQNGRMIFEERVDSVEIQLLNMLTPGKFVDNLITVSEKDSSNGTLVNISYKCGTADQRMSLGTRVRSFKDMLRKCIKEAHVKAEAEKQRLRELAKAKPKKLADLDILKDEDDDYGVDD
jgi:hypothetical protein